jgi:hypothetical protein
MGSAQSITVEKSDDRMCAGRTRADNCPDNHADANLELVKELTVGPLITGFVQGFASVGIAHWKAKRKLRLQAQSDALALDAKEGFEGVSPFIGPQ